MSTLSRRGAHNITLDPLKGKENIDLITHGAVGYVNLDICAQGSLFGAAASPSLRNIIYKANEVFPVAGNSCGHATNDCQRVDISSYIGLSGAGSDNIAFNLFAGVPSVDFYFTPDPKVDGVSSSPSYHTAYETLDLYQRFVDPDYAIMERCSQLVGALTLSLAEAELLPYNMTDLGQALLEGFGDFQTHMEDFQMHNVSAGWLEKEIDLFVQTADVWHKWICDRKSFDAGMLRIINKRMMLVERAFIKPDGLMGNPIIRNLAFGVSIENSYKTVAFSALRLQLYQVSRMKPSSAEAAQAWLDIRSNVNDIALQFDLLA
ncbi:hypothetical protein ISCGN_029193 [Ixodes scapularis]